ncbi:unnamed protein product [Camellia sinensis]
MTQGKMLLPKCVAKEIDRLQAAFLWGDSESKRKVHLVKWREVTLNKKQRRVGIRDVRLANHCMLMKWWWRLALEDDALWKQVICGKYGSTGGRWLPSIEVSVKVSNIWRDILSVPQSNPRLHSLYVENVEIKIGNGNRVLFWIDNWRGVSCLKLKFPRLYQLCSEKDISLNG